MTPNATQEAKPTEAQPPTCGVCGETLPGWPHRPESHRAACFRKAVGRY